MAALTSELDTNLITSKVKEILLQHNVGQKVWFLVLKVFSFSNISFFSCLESLFLGLAKVLFLNFSVNQKPGICWVSKEENHSSGKVKWIFPVNPLQDIFLPRMQLWLNDPNNIEKLLNVKSDMREATKRRHGLDSSSDRSSPLDTLGIWNYAYNSDAIKILWRFM